MPIEVEAGMLRNTAKPRPPALGTKYWQLWGATAVSSVGDGLVLVAFPLLAASITHNALAISGVLVASRLGWLVAALPAGALADRADRRRMAVVVEVARMAVLLSFGLIVGLAGATLPLLYVTVFGLGALEAGFFGATAAAVPDVVPATELARANGHLVVASNGGEWFAGPALGGVLFAAAAALPFVLDGASFAISALLLLAVLPRVVRRTATTTSLRRDAADGLTYLLRRPLLRWLAGLIAGFAFCQAMVLGVLVIYAQQVLHLSKGAYGVFLGVAAIGSVLGGALAGRADRQVGTTAMLLGSGLAAAGAYVLLATTHSAAVAAAALAVESGAVAWGNVASLSLRQQVVPRELLGRTGNAYRMLVWAALPLGALVGGTVATMWRTPAALAGAGMIQLAVVAVATRPLAELIRNAAIDLRSKDVIELRPVATPSAASANSAAL